MVKAWKAEGSPVTDETATGSPTSNKTLDAITAMRRDILAHRDALGLTPKGFNRLRRKAAQGEAEGNGGKTVLTLIQARRRNEA